jgi:hypothetical protein
MRPPTRPNWLTGSGASKNQAQAPGFCTHVMAERRYQSRDCDIDLLFT